MPGFPVKSLLIAPLVFIASNGAPELTHTQTPYKSGLFLSQNSDWLSRLSENDPRETLVFPLRRMRFWVSSFRFCFFCTFRFIRRFALISGLRTASIFCFLFLSTFRRLCLSRTEPESSKNSEAPNFSISAPFRSSITCGIAATASGSSPGKPVSGTGWASVTWNTIETRGTPKPSRSRLSHDWTMEVISFIPEARLRDEASPALELRPHSRLISHLLQWQNKTLSCSSTFNSQYGSARYPISCLTSSHDLVQAQYPRHQPRPHQSSPQELTSVRSPLPPSHRRARATTARHCLDTRGF
mmetsp:Transcript_19759/g.78590  ORF Transcript_19759/g.78590 Transcript_19759/m.78590 type:complete len:299 (+) Transcript_19759:931-1827(+)